LVDTETSLAGSHRRRLTWLLEAGFTLAGVGHDGLQAGEVVGRSRVSRKALRLHEAMGILFM
jgi:hypothetical protein